MEISEKLRKILEENREEYLKPLMELVAIDTQDLGHGIAGGREKEGQEYFARLLQELGADEIQRDQMTEEAIQSCLEKYSEGNPGHNYDGRYNVYGTFRGADQAKTLMFNGHMDTMPPGELSKWNIPPHEPAIIDGKLYGLGSTDMKSGLLGGAMAVKLLGQAGIELPCNVKITSVCDEEGGGNGSIQAIMSGQKADAVVVCECSNRELIAAHMGFVFFKVEVEGKSNHSGEKWAGVSAIEKILKIIRALEELEHEWLLRYKHPLLPAPNLNIGTIHGGTAGSTVAGECYFETCIHYLPVIMSYQKIYDAFTETVEAVAKSDPWLREHMPKITMYQAGGAFEQDTSDPFVSAFQEAYTLVEGHEAKIVGSPGGCDSRLWKNIAGAKVLQYGPGKLSECHAVNEYVPVEDYFQAILVYANLILTYGNSQEI